MRKPVRSREGRSLRSSLSKLMTSRPEKAVIKSTTHTADRWVMPLVALLPIVVYRNTLNHDFVYDDLPGILDNPLVGSATSFQNLWSLLGEPWRPLVQLSYAATHVLFGFTPLFYHAVNIALHTANALLVYVIASQVARLWLPSGRRNLFAAASGLLFAVHPLLSEAVAYIWGRSSSLCAFFYFGSIVFLLLGHQSMSVVRRRALFGCALACGLLAWKSKEEAITLPLVLSGFLWLVGRRVAAAGTALVPVALLAARWSDVSRLTREVAQNQQLVLAGASAALPRGLFFMTEIKGAVFYYLCKFLVPLNLNVDPYVERVNRVYDFRFLAACLVLSLGAALAILARRRQPAVSFAFIALLASPLTAYAVMPLADVVAEHRIYIAGLGVALLGGWAATMMKPRAGAMVLAAIVIVLSLATVERNKVWASSMTLWRDAEQKSPQLARPHLNLGVAYQAAGRHDEALGEYAHALSVNPRLALAYSNMSSIRRLRGDLRGAEVLLDKAIELSPGRIGPYISLAAIKIERGQHEKAIRVLDEAAKLGDFAITHVTKGEALLALGHVDQAKHEYARAGQLCTGSAEMERKIASRMREIESVIRGRPGPETPPGSSRD